MRSPMHAWWRERPGITGLGLIVAANLLLWPADGLADIAGASLVFYVAAWACGIAGIVFLVIAAKRRFDRVQPASE